MYFVQGGQNLLGVYYKEIEENQKPDWGLTLAIAYAIQSPAKGGEGDEQIVVCFKILREKKRKKINVIIEDTIWKMSSVLWTSRR